MSARHPTALEWAAWRAETRTAYERAALVALAEDVNRQSGARQARLADLAARAGMSARQVRTVLDAMAKKDRALISIKTHRAHAGSVYVLTGWIKLRGVNEAAGDDAVVELDDHRQDAPMTAPSHRQDMPMSASSHRHIAPVSAAPHRQDTPMRASSAGYADEAGSHRQVVPMSAARRNPAHIDITLEPQQVEARSSTPIGESPAEHAASRAGARALPDLLHPDALFAQITHPQLDPARTELRIDAHAWLDSWRRRGASPALIVAVVRAVMDDHGRRKPGDQVTTLKFFNRAIDRAIAAEAEARAHAEGGAHDHPTPDSAAAGGRRAGNDPTERERARTRSRQAGWSAALALGARAEPGPAG